MLLHERVRRHAEATKLVQAREAEAEAARQALQKIEDAHSATVSEMCARVEKLREVNRQMPDTDDEKEPAKFVFERHLRDACLVALFSHYSGDVMTPSQAIKQYIAKGGTSLDFVQSLCDTLILETE